MEILKLEARHRTGTGKSYTRKVRKQGWIPSVYYGHDRETKHLEVNAREFITIVRNRKTTHLVDLALPEENGDSICIIKEIQRHVLNDSVFFNIDFQHVAMNEKISVQCPVILMGTSIGVKEDGGILNHIMRNLTIQCLPSDIPEHIEIDISDLRLGKSVHIRDISIPNIELKDNPDDVVAVVVQPQAADAEVTKAAEVVEGAAPEVEGKDKEKEESEEKEGKKEKK